MIEQKCILDYQAEMVSRIYITLELVKLKEVGMKGGQDREDYS